MLQALIVFLGVIALIPILLLYSSFAWGYVSSVFYAWFVLSVFPQAPQISVSQFIGFAFFLGAILPKYTATPIKTEYKDTQSAISLLIVSPWISLGVGYLIHLFIN
jgi:hypothetical protein